MRKGLKNHPGRWDSLIRSSVRDFQFTNTLNLFRRMRRTGAAVDPHTLTAAVKACSQLRQSCNAAALHSLSFSLGLTVDPFVQTSLVDLYSRCSDISFARRLFDEMTKRSVATWNSMMTAYARISDVNVSFDLLSDMRVNGFEPNLSTFLGLLSGKVDQNQGLSLHCYVVKIGLTSELFLYNSMISMYSKLGLVDASVSLFVSMREEDRSASTWTIMVNAYADFGAHDQAMQIFNQMRYHYRVLDGAAVLSLLSAAKGETISGAHCLVIKSGGCRSVHFSNSLVNAYGKFGNLQSAARIFNSIQNKDVISWTSMIKGYTENGAAVKALTLFNQMIASGVNASCKLRTSLIDLLCKNGSVRQASEIFSRSSERDLALWSSMVNGYAINGKAPEAIDLFNEMIAQGIELDGSVFTSLFSACRHAGMITDGIDWFERMRSEFKVLPAGEHYVCMADLLGRGGHIVAAMQAAAMAPPGEMRQRAMVAAVRGERDGGIGERNEGTGERGGESCEEMLVVFRGLSSMGRWEEAAEVRMKMEEKGMVKKPGWSRIELDECSI